MFVTGAVLLAGLALAVPANAAPGQCSVTGYDTFDCDVSVDGGGIAFLLPDGRSFVFAHVSNGAGIGYLGAAGQRYPQDLGSFLPVEGEDGCWLGERSGIKFCAALLQ